MSGEMEQGLYALIGAESVSVRFRFILIVLALAGAAFFLWPTFQYYQLNGEREPLLADTTEAGRQKLADWDTLHYEDWLGSRKGRIKLGLDLRGGVYFTMEVDIPALLEESAIKGLTDDTFDQVIAATRQEALTSDEPVIDIFSQKFDELARPQGKTLLDYYDVGDLPGDAGDDAILSKLRGNVEDAVDQAEEVIRQRVDKYGLTEPSIQQQGNRRIIVELPDEKEPARVRDLLSQTARLEFKLVKNNGDIVNVFRAIDQILSGEEPAEENAPETGGTEGQDSTDTSADNTDSTTTPVANDSTGDAGDTTAPTADSNKTQEELNAEYEKAHQFTLLFATYYGVTRDGGGQAVGYDQPMPEGEYSFYIAKANIEKVLAILNRPEIKGMVPEGRQIAFSAHGEQQDADGQPIYSMFVLQADPELTGEVVVDAGADFDPANGQPMVTMAMNTSGAERWGDITGENVGKRVAVVLDSAVYSAPWIQGKIPGGHTRITGSSDIAEADLLATILKSGALKAPIKIIEERVVGPSLGQDQIDQGINAVLFAALLVILFMMIYYMLGGLVADLAVVLNVFFTLAFLAALQGTLTLPGIGALVLTIGMAVDANILIYERIREELAMGKSLRNAVQLGYDKAFSAIIDSNITTFITGVILAIFGSGPIQGFAVMLMIGIGGTLFTAVFITRAVFMLMLDRGSDSLNFGQPKAKSLSA